MLLRDFNKINTELKKVQKEVDFFEEKVRSLFWTGAARARVSRPPFVLVPSTRLPHHPPTHRHARLAGHTRARTASGD